MAETLENLTAGIKDQLAAEKKKYVILAVLFVVLLIVLARLFMDDSTPEPIQAAPVAIHPTQPVQAPARELIRPISQPVIRPTTTASGAIESNRATPAPILITGNQSAISVQGLSRELKRDPFTTSDWSVFPRVAVGNADRKEDLLRHKELLERIRSELDEMDLQSTMTGAVKTAYISGHLVSEGEQFRGFSVLRIGERHVILKKSGITQTLSMP
ncbi:MAG: hypothetical protein ACE5EQ_02725 [Phycisphaerae bacterium]